MFRCRIFVIKKVVKVHRLTDNSSSQSYKTVFLCFVIFAVKFACLLHIEKIIDSKMTLALAQGNFCVPWENS